MIDLDEPELGERLRVTARHATVGLTVEDPTEDVVELALRPADPRRRRRGRVGAAAAAVVALVVVGVVVASQGRTALSRVDAAGEAVEVVVERTAPSTVSADPAQRLREAVAATLASDSYRVRTVAVVVDGEGGQPIEGVPQPSVIPLTMGAGLFGDTVWTVDGELVEQTWTDGPARSVRDLSTSTTAWEVAPGQWQRATIEEDGVVEPLERFADFTCVAEGDAPNTLVVLAGDGTYPPDLAQDGPRRLRWSVTIRPDGRIDRIVPVRDQESVRDARSDQLFGDYDTATVELPDPARVTDVPTPEGSYIDSATGYSRPMYSKG